jgi:hypothetical protein
VAKLPSKANVDLFLRKFERLDDTLRILPTIEARYLYDQRKIYRNSVLLETVIHLRFGQLSVLDAKRIDGWHENQLRHWEVLLILSTAQNHGIVFFNKPARYSQVLTGMRYIAISRQRRWGISATTCGTASTCILITSNTVPSCRT